MNNSDDQIVDPSSVLMSMLNNPFMAEMLKPLNLDADLTNVNAQKAIAKHHDAVRKEHLSLEEMEWEVAKSRFVREDLVTKLSSFTNMLFEVIQSGIQIGEFPPDFSVFAEFGGMMMKATQDQAQIHKKLKSELGSLRIKPSEIAGKGGKAKAEKYKRLEEETIRLYESQVWESAPIAAQEITPIIVAKSKGGNGDLLPSTTKPLDWIRAHNRKTKKEQK